MPDVSEIDLYYRELHQSEWDHALSFLSSALPDAAPPTIDPDTQRLAAVVDGAGTVRSLAIVTSTIHIAYISPDDPADIRLDLLQSVAESFLPPKTVYYTMVQSDPDGRTLSEDLQMQPIAGVSVYVKRTDSDPNNADVDGSGG